MAKIKEIREKLQVISIGNLGGKDRVLKFDLNAFAELENKFGTIDNAMKALGEGSMNSVKTVLWIGLIHEEAVLDEETGEPIKYNITPYQVGSWIMPAMLPEISKKLGAAINAGMPEPTTTEQSEVTKDPKMALVVLTPEEEEEERKNK